jgi:hypothetical protein
MIEAMLNACIERKHTIEDDATGHAHPEREHDAVVDQWPDDLLDLNSEAHVCGCLSYARAAAFAAGSDTGLMGVGDGFVAPAARAAFAAELALYF